MIFGEVALEQASGALLAHGVRTASRLIAKGTLLGDDLIAALREAGTKRLTVARLEPGDVPEAEAAQRLAARLAAPHLRISKPVHGRVNIFAEAAGLLSLNKAGITGFSLIDEAITLACLPDASAVASGDMIATLKIIPFAVPAATMAAADALFGGQERLFTLKKFCHSRAGLILSRLPHLKDAAIRHTIEATRLRVTARGGSLLPPIETAHETAPIAAAIKVLRAQGAEIILVAGASAVTDRNDVAPAAIKAAGGSITRFGMPVDPGNLICFGALNDGTPAIILPGCARSPKLNGIDLVLDHVFAGDTLTAGLIAHMGIGGLLKDFSQRPEPRNAKPAASTAPRIAAIVLAAGRSTRAAPDHKLLVKLPDGRSMIETTVAHVLAADVSRVIVVTGHDADAVKAALKGRDVDYAHAPDYALGLAHSLRAGLAALPSDTSGALVCLGDMPLVEACVLNRLIAAFDPDEGRAIIVPAHRGRRGNPVLWDRKFFGEIAALEGDTGARRLFRVHMEQVAEVEMETDAMLLDFDTPDALTALKTNNGKAVP
jgi:molybdenum cofactor cytidylyltransferase